MSVVPIDEHTALLHTLWSRRGCAEQSDARYLLHSAVVERLIDFNVQILLTDSPRASRLAPGLKQFQHQTGYVPRNLIWTRPPAPPMINRRLTSAVDVNRLLITSRGRGLIHTRRRSIKRHAGRWLEPCCCMTDQPVETRG